MIHAGIHREDQLSAIGAGRLRQAVKVRIGRAVRMCVEEGEAGIVGGEVTDGKALVLEADVFARAWHLRPAGGDGKQDQDREPK